MSKKKVTKPPRKRRAFSPEYQAEAVRTPALAGEFAGEKEWWAQRRPAMAESLEIDAATWWYVWVGVWVGGDPPQGSRRELNDLVLKSNGATHLAPGLVRLTASVRLDGDAARQRFLPDLNTQAQTAGEPFDPDDIRSIRFDTTITAHTVPETLQPRSVRFEELLLVERVGGAYEQTEVRDYQFDWETSK